MQEKRYEIALAMVRQMFALAEVLFGERHPLHFIFRWLSFVTPSLLEEIVCKCSESIGGNFESLIGPMHRSTLFSRLVYIANDTTMEESHKIFLLQELLRECEVTLATTDTRIFQDRSFHAFDLPIPGPRSYAAIQANSYQKTLIDWNNSFLVAPW